MTRTPNRSETRNLAVSPARLQRVTSFVDDFATARLQSKRDRWLKRYLDSSTASPAQAPKEIFGGLSAKPHAFMRGATKFSADLFSAEHLMIEDEQSSTDIRARHRSLTATNNNKKTGCRANCTVPDLRIFVYQQRPEWSSHVHRGYRTWYSMKVGEKITRLQWPLVAAKQLKSPVRANADAEP